MSGGDKSKYYSNDEAQIQIEKFSDATWARLAQIARNRTQSAQGDDWKDLLQEACLRVVTGTRRWPRNLDAATFFFKTMQSIASDAAKSRQRSRSHIDVRLASEVSTQDPKNPVNVIDEHPDDAATPEQEHVAREQEGMERESIEAFIEKFENPLTREVIQWILEGFKKAEIQEALELDDRAYDTHTKRIRRAAARAGKKESK